MGAHEYKKIQALRELRLPIVQQCHGCVRIDGERCNVYINPEAMWRNNDCLMASTVMLVDESEPKKPVNPLKASKRGSTGG